MIYPWERRQAEREARAAAETVERLERALVANDEELSCRRQQLGDVRAAVAANHARMEAANEAGVRIVFDGSRREAEPLFEQVPMSAVEQMEAAIKDGERLTGEEGRLLGQVTGLERRRDQIVRTLERWRTIAAGLCDGLVALDGPEPAPTDYPTGSAPAVGTAGEEAAERAEAVAVAGPGAQPAAPSQPAASSSALNIRNRLDAIGRRLAGW